VIEVEKREPQRRRAAATQTMQWKKQRAFLARLLAHDDQDNQKDDAAGHRDIQH